VSEPLVSIVTPSMNQGRWLEQALRSVLDQDYPHIEYLVMDGGSTDGSLDILRRHEPRVTWQSGPDGGQSQALRTAYSQMKGEILGWVNADDAYLPGAVTRAVRALQADPTLGMVYGNAAFIDAESRPLGPAVHVTSVGESDPLLRLGDCIVQPAAFFRRSAYEAVGGLDPALHYTMDYDLWLRLARRFPSRHLDATLAQVRLVPTTKTASGGWKRMAEVEAIVRKNGGTGLPAWFAIEAAAMHAREAFSAVRQARLGAASASAAAAVRTVASRRTIAALALPLTWRMVRRRLEVERATRPAAAAGSR
jgi:glycosyltransferase involved in cell wall biosynthesis